MATTSFVVFAFMTGVAFAADVKEVAIDSAIPPTGLVDVIIEASVTKTADDSKKDNYTFDFVIRGVRFSRKVAGEQRADGKLNFAVRLRIRMPVGRRVIKFDSPEKLRPYIVNADFEEGKVHLIQFRPVYSKGMGKMEYEAWMDGKKIPIRYERFNIH